MSSTSAAIDPSSFDFGCAGLPDAQASMVSWARTARRAAGVVRGDHGWIRRGARAAQTITGGGLDPGP